MARIVFASAAYLGDVAPFVEPANRLADRGHDVAFLVPHGFSDVLAGERFGLLLYALDFSSAAMHRDPVHERLMRHPFATSLRLARYWMRKGLVGNPSGGRASLLEHLAGGLLVHRASQVAGAVATIDADPSYARRAAELAGRMEGEDGAGALVEVVESLL